jgi:hypothetical protein
VSCRSGSDSRSESSGASSVLTTSIRESKRLPPSSDCERSYEQTKAVIEANPLPPIELASREIYLRDCAKLPLSVQKCLVFDHALRNQAECAKARAEYDATQTSHGGPLP